jgi:hypothetical protein
MPGTPASERLGKNIRGGDARSDVSRLTCGKPHLSKTAKDKAASVVVGPAEKSKGWPAPRGALAQACRVGICGAHSLKNTTNGGTLGRVYARD